MGRKKLAATKSRSKTASFRLTLGDWKRLDTISAKLQLSKSKTICRLINSVDLKDKDAILALKEPQIPEQADNVIE